MNPRSLLTYPFASPTLHDQPSRDLVLFAFTGRIVGALLVRGVTLGCTGGVPFGAPPGSSAQLETVSKTTTVARAGRVGLPNRPRAIKGCSGTNSSFAGLYDTVYGVLYLRLCVCNTFTAGRPKNKDWSLRFLSPVNPAFSVCSKALLLCRIRMCACMSHRYTRLIPARIILA